MKNTTVFWSFAFAWLSGVAFFAGIQNFENGYESYGWTEFADSAFILFGVWWVHGQEKRAQKAAQSAKESPETKQAVKWAAEETKGLEDSIEKHLNKDAK